MHCPFLMFVIRFDDDDGRIPSLEGINVKPVFDSVVVGGRKMDTGQVDSRNKVRLHGERGANNVSKYMRWVCTWLVLQALHGT